MFIVNNLDELEEVAKEISINHIKKFNFLNGDIGAGKTTFVSLIAPILGAVDTVISPTFSIINRYRTTNSKDIYHIDLYRLESIGELEMTGFYDLIDSDAYFFIEWADKLNLLDEFKTALQINFNVNNGVREITVI